MTVSNVINGREGRVSAATVERVKAVIEELGYVRNEQARSLGGAASRIIAVVYQTNVGYSSLSSPYDAQFIGACENAAREQGYVLMLCGGTSAAEVRARLRGWQVDGAVVMATTTISPAELLAEVGVPCVFLDNYDDDFEGSSVNIHDREGAWIAGEHLRKLGHESALVVGPTLESSGVMRERYEGFIDGFSGCVDFVPSEVSFEGGAQLGEQIARGLRATETPHESNSSISAVFVGADILAIGIIHALRRAGIEVPGEVSVIGFDGIEAGKYLDTALTTIEQPVDDKAIHAVRELVRQIRGAAKPERISLPVSLREGETIGARKK